MLQRLVSSFRSNPIINRHLATTFTGPRLGVAFLLVTGCLFTLYAALFTEATYRSIDPGLAYFSHVAILLGVLIVLLPIKVSGVIEGPRINRAFDQVVATGASPSTLYWGAWVSGLAYATLLLFVTIPFVACLVMFGDTDLWTICRGYATLLIYSNVIIAVTLALSVYGREWVSTPVAIAILFGIGLLSFIPDRDWVRYYPVVLAELSPARMLIEQAVPDDPGFHPALSAPAPTILLWQLPIDYVRPVLWSIVVAICAVIFTIGPGHVFSPGLDNFGAVVLRGDRKRGILGRLRGGITRRVEMAFFYENAPPWTARWGHIIRYTLAALPILVTMALLVGAVWGQSLWPQNWNFYNDEKGPASIWVGGGILAFWSLLTVTTRKNVLAVHPVGSRSLRTELLLVGLFVILLGALFLIQSSLIPQLEALVNKKRTFAPNSVAANSAQVAGYVEAFWQHLTAMLMLVTNLFLIGRLASRVTNNFLVARSVAVAGYCAMMAVPAGVYALLRETELSESFTPVTYFSPVVLVPMGDGATWIAGLGWERFMSAHGILAGVLLVVLALRYLPVWRGGRRSGVGGVLFALCAAGSLGAQDPQPGSPLRVKNVSRGFGGVTFSSGVDFFTVEVENVSEATITARYWIETFSGPWGFGDCVVSPGTTRTVRFGAAPDRSNARRWRSTGDSKIVFQAGGHVMRSKVLDLTQLNLTVMNTRQPGGNNRTQTTEQHLFVGARGSFPQQWIQLAMAGNTQNLVSCEPREIPISVRDFAGIEVIWMTADALARLGPQQQKAMYQYALMGGTVMFSGALPSAELVGSGIWEELLRPEREWTSRLDEHQLQHVSFPEGREVSIPLSDNGPAVPILHLRGVGAGHLGHMSLPPSVSKMPEVILNSQGFWKGVDATLPRGGFAATSRGLGDTRESGDYASLWMLGGYYLVYAIGLSAGLFVFARRRRHRRRLWILIPALPVAFLGLVPVLIAVANSRPSLVEHTEVALFHAGSTHGLASRHMLIHSSGKQDHEMSMKGRSPVVFAGVDSDWRYRSWYSRRVQIAQMMPVPVAIRGDSEWRFDLAIAPWTSGELFLFDSVTIPESVTGTARRRGVQFDIEAQVPESLRGRAAFAVVQSAAGTLIAPLIVGRDGAARARLGSKKRNNNRNNQTLLPLHRMFVFSARSQLGGQARNLGATRVFVGFAPKKSDQSPPVITSEDLVYERDVSKRTADRSARGARLRRIRRVGERYVERLDHKLMLFEIPLASTVGGK